MTAVSSPPEQHIALAIRERLGNAVDEVRVSRRDRMSVVARKETIREVAELLKRFGFDHAVSVSGIDRPDEKKIEVLYFLSSFSRNDLKRIVILLRVKADRENGWLPSLTSIWESVNLFERETYEMFGVKFEGHPDLRKLLLQDNWDGVPPLRKDLKIPEMG